MEREQLKAQCRKSAPVTRVAMLGPYPAINGARGGISSVVSSLTEALVRFTPLDALQVIMLTKQRDLAFLPGPEKQSIRVIQRLPVPGFTTAWNLDRLGVLRALREFKPDLIHVHGQATEALTGLTSTYPVVQTVHGIAQVEAALHRNPVRRLTVGSWDKWVEKFTLGRAQDIIVIAPYVAEAIRPMTRARFHAVDNPIADDFFTIRRTEHPGIRALFVGNIIARKGVLDLLMAFKRLLDTAATDSQLAVHLPVTLQLIGAPKDEAYFTRVKNYIETQHLQDVVLLRGLVSDEQVRIEYGASDLLVLPSIEESAPIVIEQAMAAGIPVVASAVGGIPYLVESESTGLLVPARDIAALSQALRRLIADPGLRLAMGTRARAEAQRRFAAKAVAERTYAIYCKARAAALLHEGGRITGNIARQGR